MAERPNGRPDGSGAGIGGAVEASLAEARRAAESGRYALAERAARRAADLDPTPRSAEMLALVLSRQRRYREAAELFRACVSAAPDLVSSWNGLGECLGNLGELGAALPAFEQAVSRDPGFLPARLNLARLLAREGRRSEAAGHLEQLLATAPEHVPALMQLAALRHGLGDYAGAARLYQRVLGVDAARADAYTGLGASLQMAGDLQGARDAYERALDRNPRQADAHFNLGTAWQGLRDPERAEACFRKALEIEPGHAGAVSGLASLLDRQGRYADALALLESRLAREGERADPELVITAAQVLRHLGRAREGISLVERRIGDHSLTSSGRQRLAFQLGDLLDAEGRYDAAFSAYAEGNRRKPVRFDRAEFAADVRRLETVFADGWQACLPMLDEPSERPVFVLGMPRSGTSLAEQIIAAHPAAAGAGELTDLPRLAMDLAPGRFPENVTGADRQALASAATAYLERLAREDPAARRVTDKTPANFLFIGFIEMLFPRARIIHCVRHPLDTALSCYFQNFAGQGIPFSYDLENIAAHLNGYFAAMAHWRRVSRLARFDLVYEELATDQETVTRRLLDFLDLPWDDACLCFHEQDRLVSTASHAQVRQPMYARSVGRFRHYETHLSVLREQVDWAAWEASGVAERVAAAMARAEAS